MSGVTSGYPRSAGLRLPGTRKSQGSGHKIPMTLAYGDGGLGEGAVGGGHAVWTQGLVNYVLPVWLLFALAWRVGVAVKSLVLAED